MPEPFPREPGDQGEMNVAIWAVKLSGMVKVRFSQCCSIDFEVGAHYIILPHGFAKTHPHLVQAHEERGQRGQHHSSKRLAQMGGVRLKLIDPQESHGALQKGD